MLFFLFYFTLIMNEFIRIRILLYYSTFIILLLLHILR